MASELLRPLTRFGRGPKGTDHVIAFPETDFALSDHARTVLQERNISVAWVSETLSNPERLENDRKDPALVHAMRPVPERSDRVLRVVYNTRSRPPCVVTAFFDRCERRGK